MPRPTLELLNRCNRAGAIKTRREFAGVLRKELTGFNLLNEEDKIFKMFKDKEEEMFPPGCVVKASFINYLDKLIQNLQDIAEEYKEINEYSSGEEKQRKIKTYILLIKTVEKFISEAINKTERDEIKALFWSVTKFYKSGEAGTRGRPRKIKGVEEITRILAK